MNKVLVNIYIPLFDEEIELFIPINKKVGVITRYFLEYVSEKFNYDLNKLSDMRLYNRENSLLLDNNVYVKTSGIQNGTKLFLL